MASHKLKKLQTIRRIEREDAEPAFGGKLEARNPKPVPFDKLRAGSEQRRRIRNERALRRKFRGTKPICAGLNGLNIF